MLQQYIYIYIYIYYILNIHLFLVCYLVYFFRNNIRFQITLATKQIEKPYFSYLSKHWLSFMYASTLFLFVLLISLFLPSYFHGLIANSKISFNLNNLFELDAYSFCGFLCIGIALYTYYLILDVTISSIRGDRKTDFTCFLIGSLLYLLSCFIYFNNIWQIAFPIALSGVVFSMHIGCNTAAHSNGRIARQYGQAQTLLD